MKTPIALGMALTALLATAVSSDANADTCSSGGSCLAWANLGTGAAITAGAQTTSAPGLYAFSSSGDAVLAHAFSNGGHAIDAVADGSTSTTIYAQAAASGATAIVASNTAGTALWCDGNAYVNSGNLTIWSAGDGIKLKSNNGSHCATVTLNDAGTALIVTSTTCW